MSISIRKINWKNWKKKMCRKLYSAAATSTANTYCCYGTDNNKTKNKENRTTNCKKENVIEFYFRQHFNYINASSFFFPFCSCWFAHLRFVLLCCYIAKKQKSTKARTSDHLHCWSMTFDKKNRRRNNKKKLKRKEVNLLYMNCSYL